MTPEQKAREIADRMERAIRLEHLAPDIDQLETAIASAIREAVAAEREACARVAEAAEFGEMYARRDGYFAEGWSTARVAIAAAIRSRKEGEEG